MKTLFLYLAFAVSFTAVLTPGYAKTTALPLNFTTVLTFEQQKDSVPPRVFFPQYHGQQKWRPMFMLDTKRALFSTWPVGTFGVRIGVEHKGIQVFNVGYFLLGAGSTFMPSFELFHPEDTDQFGVSYRGSYGALYYERTLIRTKRFAFSIPLYFKFGQIRGFGQNTMGENRIEILREPFSALATGVQFQYYLLEWFGPKIALGYRSVLQKGTDAKTLFDGYYFGLSARIHWDILYEKWKNREKKN